MGCNPPGSSVHAISQARILEWERLVFIPIPKKSNAKECSNYHTIVLTSHASKVMLKILQARLQQYMNPELPDVQAGFRKGRRTRDQIANLCWIIEKTREFQKNIYFCFIDYVKTFDCGSQQTVVNSSKRLEYQITFTVSWEICIQVKKQQLEPDMEQQTVQNWERSTSRLYIVTLLI